MAPLETSDSERSSLAEEAVKTAENLNAVSSENAQIDEDFLDYLAKNGSEEDLKILRSFVAISPETLSDEEIMLLDQIDTLTDQFRSGDRPAENTDVELISPTELRGDTLDDLENQDVWTKEEAKLSGLMEWTEGDGWNPIPGYDWAAPGTDSENWKIMPADQVPGAITLDELMGGPGDLPAETEVEKPLESTDPKEWINQLPTADKIAADVQTLLNNPDAEQVTYAEGISGKKYLVTLERMDDGNVRIMLSGARLEDHSEPLPEWSAYYRKVTEGLMLSEPSLNYTSKQITLTPSQQVRGFYTFDVSLREPAASVEETDENAEYLPPTTTNIPAEMAGKDSWTKEEALPYLRMTKEAQDNPENGWISPPEGYVWADESDPNNWKVVPSEGEAEQRQVTPPSVAAERTASGPSGREAFLGRRADLISGSNGEFTIDLETQNDVKWSKFADFNEFFLEGKDPTDLVVKIGETSYEWNGSNWAGGSDGYLKLYSAPVSFTVEAKTAAPAEPEAPKAEEPPVVPVAPEEPPADTGRITFEDVATHVEDNEIVTDTMDADLEELQIALKGATATFDRLQRTDFRNKEYTKQFQRDTEQFEKALSQIMEIHANLDEQWIALTDERGNDAILADPTTVEFKRRLDIAKGQVKEMYTYYQTQLQEREGGKDLEQTSLSPREVYRERMKKEWKKVQPNLERYLKEAYPDFTLNVANTGNGLNEDLNKELTLTYVGDDFDASKVKSRKVTIKLGMGMNPDANYDSHDAAIKGIAGDYKTNMLPTRPGIGEGNEVLFKALEDLALDYKKRIERRGAPAKVEATPAEPEAAPETDLGVLPEGFNDLSLTAIEGEMAVLNFDGAEENNGFQYLNLDSSGNSYAKSVSTGAVTVKPAGAGHYYSTEQLKSLLNPSE